MIFSFRGDLINGRDGAVVVYSPTTRRLAAARIPLAYQRDDEIPFLFEAEGERRHACYDADVSLAGNELPTPGEQTRAAFARRCDAEIATPTKWPGFRGVFARANGRERVREGESGKENVGRAFDIGR